VLRWDEDISVLLLAVPVGNRCGDEERLWERELDELERWFCSIMNGGVGGSNGMFIGYAGMWAIGGTK